MTLASTDQDSAPAAARARRIDRGWLLLALLWLLHALTTVLWLRLDNRFPAGETAVELTRAIRVAGALGQPSLDVLSRVGAAAAGQPPLYYVTTAPLIWLFGPGADPASLVNLGWLALFIAGVYGLSRRLFSTVANFSESWQLSSPPALAAAALASLYPLVIAYTRIYDPALAVAALAALAVWLLVESRGLQRRGQAFGFGLALAAGLMASPAFWMVVVGPALIGAGQAIATPRPARGSRRAPSRNALERLGRRLRLAPAHVNLLVVLLLVALTVPFALALGQPAGARAGGPLSLLSQLDDALGGFLLLLLLAGVALGLWQVIRPQRAGARLAFGLPLAWLGLGLALLALLGNGRASQLMPLLPAAALLTVAWPWATKLPTLRRVGNFVVVGALLVAVVNALVIAWGAPSPLVAALRAPAGEAAQPFAVNAPLWSPGRALYHRWPPQQTKAQTAAVGQAAARVCGDASTCRAVVLSCLPTLGPEAFDYFLAQSGAEGQVTFQSLAPNVNFYYDLWDADLVISASDVCSDGDAVASRRMAAAQAALSGAEFGQRFRSVDSFGPLPDGSQVALLRRVGPPIAEMDLPDQVLALEHVLNVSPNASAASQALSSALDQIGDPVRALALREEIVARNPEDASARVALGDAYRAYGRPQDAVEQYQAALGGDDAASLASEGDASAALSMTRPAVLLKLADAYNALGQWEEAESAFAQAVDLAPDDYDVRVSQGQFFVERGRFGDATSALADARRIDPDRFEAYLALAQAQLLRNDLELAEEQFQLAQQAAPAAPEPLLAWADALAARGELNRASPLYDQAVNLATASGAAPGVIDAYGRWIRALQAPGSTERVRTLAETLAATYPDSPQALAILGDLYRRQGLAQEAAETYQAALDLAPLDATLRVALVETLVGLGQQDDAEALLAAGLALPAGRAELLTAQAGLRTSADQLGEAVRAYQEALQTNPSYWQAAAGLARLYLARDQGYLALQTVDAALERRPGEAVLHTVRGGALRSLGRRQDALLAYRQAIELTPPPLTAADPNNSALAQLYTSLGELQLEARNFSAAQDSFERALRYDAGYAPTHVGLARLDAALAVRERASSPADAASATVEARIQRAVDAAQTALALDPANVAAYALLGDLYAAFGRNEEALAAYQEALTLDPAGASALRSSLTALYLAEDRGDELIAFFRQLLRQHPASVDALVGLADAHIAAGQPEAALDAYDLFLVQNRDNVAALLAQGSALRQLGRPEAALTAFQRAGRLAPASQAVQPQIEQARTLRDLERLEEAEAAYRRAIALVEDPARGRELSGDPALAYVELARLLLAQNRIDEATAVSDAALAAQPENPALQVLAGDLSLNQGRRAEALAAYRRALDLAPDNAVAQTRVGDLLLQSGSLAEAQTAYEAALESDPANPAGLLGLARALSRSAGAVEGALTPAQQASLARAEALLRTLLAQQPAASGAAQLVLGDVLFAQGRSDEAAEAYQAVLLQDPENASAIDGLARTLLAGGNVEEAIASYQAAADAAPSPQVRSRWLMTLAAAYRSLGRADEAEQTYLAMIAADPADSAARLALGDLYQAGERLDEAIEQYRQAAEASDGGLAAAARLGRTLLRAGRVDEAAGIAQTLLAGSPSAYEPYLLAARVAEAQGDAGAALANLRQAQNLAPTNSVAQTLVGDSYLSLGRLDDALAVYNTAAALEPRNSSALVGIGRIYLARERLVDAEGALRRALAAAPGNVAVQATLGRVLLRAGRPAEAIPLLEAAVAQNASHPTAVQDLADSYLAEGRIDEGLAIYRTSLNLDPADEQLVIGQALLNAGRLDEGLAELEAFVAGRPDDVRGLLALAPAYQQAGRADEAAEMYQRAVQAAPDDVAPRILQGNFLLAQQSSGEAAAAFEAAVGLVESQAGAAQPETSATLVVVEPWQAWIGLARANQQLGRYNEALQAAEAGEALRPDVAAFSLQIGDILRASGRTDEALAAYRRAAGFGASTAPLTRQGALYLQLNQPDQALDVYEEALATDPGDVDALLGLAQAYAVRGGGVDPNDFANAETRLRRAAQLTPDNAAVPVALGDLYAAYGRMEDAAAQYRQALTLQPDNATTLQRLGSALLAAGQAEDALAVQRQRLELLPGDRGVLLDLAQVYRALARSDDAEATYRQILRAAPNDATAKIGLGDLYMEQGLADQAAPLYQEAQRDASDPLLAAQAADQLGKAYLRLGETGQALAVAQALVLQQPAAARGYLLLGSVYEAQGDAEAALAAYQQGISQAEGALPLQLRLGELYLSSGQAADAQTLYEALTRSNPRAVDAFVGLARAHIAQLPDLQALRYEWATQALRSALRLNPNATSALTAQGDLMMAYQRPAEAASAYSAALASRAANSADDSALRLKLADALAAAGQWDDALQEYQRLATTNPTDLGMQMALGNAYRLSGDLQRALEQYRRITQAVPAYPYAHIKVGEVLDELGQPDQALAAYQAAAEVAPGNADAVLNLAVAYRRRGMVAEAIAAFEAGLAIDPTREPARVALEELRTKGK